MSGFSSAEVHRQKTLAAATARRFFSSQVTERERDRVLARPLHLLWNPYGELLGVGGDLQIGNSMAVDLDRHRLHMTGIRGRLGPARHQEPAGYRFPERDDQPGTFGVGPRPPGRWSQPPLLESARKQLLIEEMTDPVGRRRSAAVDHSPVRAVVGYEEMERNVDRVTVVQRRRSRPRAEDDRQSDEQDAAKHGDRDQEFGLHYGSSPDRPGHAAAVESGV
jgi:hypothetical protein